MQLYVIVMSPAIDLSVRLWTKWVWVRIQLLSFLNVLYPNVLIHCRSDPEPLGLYDIWISFMTHLWPTYGLLEWTDAAR